MLSGLGGEAVGVGVLAGFEGLIAAAEASGLDADADGSAEWCGLARRRAGGAGLRGGRGLRGGFGRGPRALSLECDGECVASCLA